MCMCSIVFCSGVCVAGNGGGSLLRWIAHALSRYGAKAAAKLATVRGKDFRHEKTKRKRSYVGGKIDMSSHSIKFSNSDDDS
jgi:hypothetical protein